MTPSALSRPARLVVALALAAASLVSLPGGMSAADAAAAEVFLSEFVEGSSNNKALEIANETGAPVNLADGGYDIQMYFNGSSSAGLTIALTGTVVDGNVHVVAHANAAPEILAQSDQVNGAGWFNGNDAVVLRKAGTIIDRVGQVGFDPGAEWGADDTSTANNTLRRMPDVCAGDPDAFGVFDPAATWTGHPTDTFDGLGTHTSTCAGPAVPIINEFSASTGGTDVEYIELLGSATTDLGAYTVLEIEGDGAGAGVVDEVIVLGSTDASGRLTMDLPANTFENGSITLLLVEGFTGALTDDLDSDNDGVLDSTPWTAVVDAVAVWDGGGDDHTYGEPVLGPNYDGVSSFAPGGASRIPDGVDTDAAADWVRNDFDLAGIDGFVGTIEPGEAYNTPGAPNEAFEDDDDPPPPDGQCPDSPEVTPIPTVQDDGDTTPCAGEEVTIEGVVVGDYEGPSPALRGFYVQDPAGDGDPATSDGIFVFNGNADDVSLGDTVSVTGTAGEFQGQTQVSAASVAVTGTGTVTTTQVSLPTAAADAFEAVEGMLVAFPQTLTVTEFFQLGRFGQIVMSSDGRLPQPTAVAAPGADANAVQAANDLNRIIVDDSTNDQNPEPILFGRGGEPLTALNTLRGGDTVDDLTGVMTYTWAGNSASGNAYRVRPVGDLSDLAPGGGVPEFEATNPRPSSAPDVGGSLTVASFNVLNYFVTLDTDDTCSPTLDQDCRGADTQEELDRQRAKLVSALLALDADVVGLVEIENTPEVDPAGDIAALVNDELGAEVYAGLDTGVIGTDAIRVGMIYKPDAVALAGDFAILDSSVDPRFNDGKNRPVLAQTVVDHATGGKVTLAVNHLKSKGSDCNDLGDPDVGDGQGNCNLTRTAAAEAMADWLAGDPTGSGDADTLVMGDLNAYAMEDPVTALTDAGYTNLVAASEGTGAYSFAFDGQWGYLDHALASPTLASQVTGVAEYHINADEPSVLDYNTDFKSPSQVVDLYAPDEFRTSDHDPVVIGLDLLHREFDGFHGPVANPPAVNEITAGQTVPFEFELSAGLDVDPLFDGFPTVQAVDCTTGEPVGDATALPTRGGGLQYDPATGAATYLWRTSRADTGCAVVTFLFDDGTRRTALFTFR